MANDFGPYEILEEIGRGGMGVVYQALDRRSQRMVAIKQLTLENVDPTKHREFRDRFRREAAMASRLNHPGIVSVYDVGDTADNNFFVMEYLEGVSLRKHLELKGGRISPEEYFPILRQVAEGLGYAHSLNLVHRDVKPDNIIILPDGTVKVTDFGIARTADFEQTHLTKTGVMLGTLAYVSPEQLQDAKNVDHRADIFSLGVVSYECLCGQLPFEGEGIAQTVIKIVSSEAKPPHVLVPSINVEISEVISKSMRKKSRDRYLSMLDFAREFQRAMTDGTPATADSLAPVQGGTQDPARSAGGGIKVYTPGVPLEAKSSAAPGGVSNHRAHSPSSTATRVSLSGTSYQLAKPLSIIGKQGEGNGCFLEPSVIACRSGRIVVGDTGTRKVQSFSRDGRWLNVLGTSTDSKSSRTGGRLTTPSGLALDFRGRVYVSDSSDHFIRVFDGQGRFLKELINSNGKEGGINGLVCDSTGLLYISDPDNGCIHVFQSDLGTYMRRLGSKGTEAGQLQIPGALCVDRQNQVYVVDYGTARVSIFSKTGLFLRTFGGKGAANGQFNVPRGIAVDKNDRIYVADSLNHRVQIFGATGEWIHSFGVRGGELGKFMGPAGLSIDPENNCLYVADRGNHRVQVFELLVA